MMSRDSGFLIDFERQGFFYSKPTAYRTTNVYSEALSSLYWRSNRKELFIISSDSVHIDYLCLAIRKRKVVTNKSKVEFTKYLKINPVLTIESVDHELGLSMMDFFNKVSSDLIRMTYYDWQRLIDYIKSSDPENKEKIDELIEDWHTVTFNGQDSIEKIFSKDAANTSLNFAGINRGTAEISYYKHSDEAELPPHLEGVESMYLREDRMIIHDSKIFSDWTSVPVSAFMTTQYRQGDKVLTIQNFNRESVEQYLGVDLLYYNHFYRSYVLIQYKRMAYEGTDSIYRLNDPSYSKELTNMNNLERLLSTGEEQPDSLEDYRFHKDGICYFKLCETHSNRFHNSDLVQGMYIPLDYWNRLIKDERTVGIRGGRNVSKKNVGRYFNNSEFITLVKHGWIGSNQVQTEKLSLLIQEILNSGRSLILAEYTNRKEK